MRRTRPCTENPLAFPTGLRQAPGPAATSRLRLALAAAVLAGHVHASEPENEDGAGEDTIVVVGKEGGAPDELPGSYTVVTEERLETHGMRTVRDASISVPNLYLTEFSARRLSLPFLRGIGAGQGDPAVITYIDGVPQFGFGGVNLPLVDVERVEFLRGPQGTLYGRNALGGLIHVVTERPGREPALEARLGAGDHGAFEAETSVSGPLGERAGGRLSALHAQRDGYTTNEFTGNDVDFRDSFYGRAQVQVAASDDSVLRFTTFGERARDGGFVLSDLEGLRQDPHTIDQDFEGVTERDVLSPSVVWERFGRDVDATVVGAYQSWDVLETSDFDFTTFDVVRRRTEEEQDYGYLEVRLASTERTRPAPGATPRWIVGVSGFRSDAERSARNAFRSDAPLFGQAPGVALDTGEFEDTGVGLFGQATFAVAEDVDVTAGLRLEHESKEADLEQTFSVGGAPVTSSSQDLDEDFEEVMPKVSAAWHADETATFYAQAARGFKAGGFNLSAPDGSRAFGPETVWSYELGAKLALGAARLNAALFLVDWEDMQLSQFDPQTGGFVENAGESTSRGVEVDLAVPITESFRLTSAAGYADTEFDDFVDSFGNDVSGNDLPFAPETTFSVGAEYVAELAEERELFVTGDFTRIGDFHYDPGNLGRESYEVADFTVGYRHGRWGLRLTLRNAFDEVYFPVAFQANPADPTAFVAETGAPRTVFVSVQYGG